MAGVSLPFPPQERAVFAEALEQLRREGIVHYITLRPLPRPRFDAEVAIVLGAKPELALRERTWQLTHGWPGAAVALLRIHDDHDIVRIADQHAFLTPWHGYPRLVETDEPVRWIRRQGDLMWKAAKAVAVLDPLGPALPVLLADAVGVSEPEAVDLLARLHDVGALHFRRSESAWRFRIPLVGAALRAVLGPYERRRLAKIAVEAIWSGDASCADPGYLPDQLAFAGRLVDPERARRELLFFAGQAAFAGGDATIAWLRAAAELTADRAERAEHGEILLAHARTCLARGRADLALQSSSTLLTRFSDEIPSDELVGALFVHVMALHETKDLDTLERVARDDLSNWRFSQLEEDLCRAFALSLLGRWRETQDLLDALRHEPGAGAIEANIDQISPVADLWLGLTGKFDQDVADLPGRVARGELPTGELIYHSGALLALGELDRAEDLLDRTSKVPIRLTVPSQMAREFYRGEFDEALELTRKNIATGSPHGCDVNQSVMFQLAALLQLSRGKLTHGRELCAMARSRQPTLPHVLALPESLVETMFRNIDGARTVLLEAAMRAEDAGIVAHTNGLWTGIAEIAIATGLGADRLPECMKRLDEIADQIGSEPAEIQRLSLRAFADSDQRAARTALQLLRKRGQVYELATGIERLVRFGVADPALLYEAYEHYGTMDALMRRSWLRRLMQEHRMAVPGRQATTAENERLLAVLISEGLSNKQIAAVLNTSEKSVEGRLSRLFSRSGYKSRVKLATAMLTAFSKDEIQGV
ncbi:LuxR C-terminal-related transcriptional regulator [Amycolatopsis sp. NPDC059657]|uniref:helix-turn-helix transcriptional regulator n=1 Tax=Amycolatopsis sp. NPDC059657 TaxID=3346899 RepID=UPI00366D23DC